MHNPFEILSSRLSNLEALALQILNKLSQEQAAEEVGGMALAQEVTRLSKPRIYALVATRDIPHSKRGNRLHFNRADLMQWVAGDKRDVYTSTND